MLDLVLLFFAVVFVVFLLVISHLRIVPESEAWVMERLGVYSRTWHTGLHLKVPFIERQRGERIDLREQILVIGEKFNHTNYPADTEKRGHFDNDYYPIIGQPESQPVITKDNVRMHIDTVIFYQITDPKLFTYGHKYPIHAIEHLASTTLRNLIGELELDETLTSRDTINTKLRTVLDEATDAWGIRVTRVELKNIIISDKELSEAMEKQMIAERERRAAVIKAEGVRKAAILEAEGVKQSMILTGQGEAEKIRLVQEATADGLKMINDAAPTAEAQNIYLGVKSLQAFEKAADGQATKIIIPSEIQGLAGLAKSASEVFNA